MSNNLPLSAPAPGAAFDGLRSKLLELLERLDELGEHQASAYLSMSLDCLECSARQKAAAIPADPAWARG